MMAKKCICCFTDNPKIKLTKEDVQHIKDIVGDFCEVRNLKILFEIFVYISCFLVPK